MKQSFRRLAGHKPEIDGDGMALCCPNIQTIFRQRKALLVVFGHNRFKDHPIYIETRFAGLRNQRLDGRPAVGARKDGDSVQLISFSGNAFSVDLKTGRVKFHSFLK